VDSELEVIRTEMDATRDSLAQKIGELESQVRETVSEAGAAVSATKEGVMDVVSSVSDTVSHVKESIKETFDLGKQVEAHPWGAFGVAVAAGMAGGLLLGSRPTSVPLASGFAPHTPSHTPYTPAAAASAASSEPSMVSSVFSKLQNMAIASLVDIVQDMVRQSAPEPWKQGLQDIVREVSTKLTSNGKTGY